MLLRHREPRGTAPLHRHPPLTPAGAVLAHPGLLPLVVISFSFLAVAAAWDGGSLLLWWDEPIQRWVEGSRTPALDTFFRGASHLGGLVVVLLGLVALLYVVYRRCHGLAMVLLVAVLARPPLEWALKELVGRDRPDFERMVPGNGPSFPTGHVMAAVALWGLVPPVVALVVHRRTWWWISVALSSAAVVLVAASRIYLGVHWFSDVVGALLLGSLYLLGVERLLEWHHRRRGCIPLDDAERIVLPFGEEPPLVSTGADGRSSKERDGPG